jgi:hypothetical protein
LEKNKYCTSVILSLLFFLVSFLQSRESASGLYAKLSLTQHTKQIKTKKTSTVTVSVLYIEEAEGLTLKCNRRRTRERQIDKRG